MVAKAPAMRITCSGCGYSVTSNEVEHHKLLGEVKDWINWVLVQQAAKDGTARLLNQRIDCPPCPRCKAVGCWTIPEH